MPERGRAPFEIMFTIHTLLTFGEGNIPLNNRHTHAQKEDEGRGKISKREEQFPRLENQRDGLRRFTCMTLPYCMTDPMHFLVSVSFCFFSTSAAC